jgi:hypothetical protein
MDKKVSYKEILIFGVIFSVTQYISFLLFYYDVDTIKEIFMALYVIVVTSYAIYLIYREQNNRNVEIFYHSLILIGFAVCYSILIGGLYY